MDSSNLFDQLITAETEDEVESVLNEAGVMGADESMWLPLGGFENNFAAVANQQSDATAALIEKVVNGIDAVLMAQCYEAGIDPEGPNAPSTMGEAVERFFGIPEGRIGYLDARQREKIADNIHVVAVGPKPPNNASYLVIDRGEGQSPERFPETFLSIQKSNKMRIPFVQGKFNSGGLGVLQFCGDRNNFQLIASRRHPSAPVPEGDLSKDLWGFTIIRRLRPAYGRRSSEYVYLAPCGEIPSFQRDAIRVLPGPSRANKPGEPYAADLPFGTCLKLYGFRWKARSIATTEARYELERLFHVPALPFRLHETRDYRANYLSTTVSGGWDAAVTGESEGESTKLEPGFPGPAELNLEGIGRLPYQIALYKPATKHVPHGVFFNVNGQVHGSLPSNFFDRRLKLDRIKDDLFVAVDCTDMDPMVREDFFMASRDRVRKNEDYSRIEQALAEELRSHPGLQAVNQLRRQQEMERSIDDEAALSAFQNLIKSDPSLQSLFAGGDNLVGTTGPVNAPEFRGKRFPSFFQLAKEPKDGLIKYCPTNLTCRVDFHTDAVNDYFDRLDSPGVVSLDPPNLIERQRLWNGEWHTYFRPPWNAEPGDECQITVSVSDVERDKTGSPFVVQFKMVITPAELRESPTGPKPPRPGPRPSPGPHGVVLALPKVREVHRCEWEAFAEPFHSKEAIRVLHGEGSEFDYLVNMDNSFLLTDLTRTKDELKPQRRFWFKYGLVLAAVGIIRHQRIIDDERDSKASEVDEEYEFEEDLEVVNRACNGLARVIIPIIGSLGRAGIVD